MTNSKAQTSSPIPSPDHFTWRVGEGCGVKDSEVVRCALDVNVDVGVVLALGVSVVIGVGSCKCVADGTNVPDRRNESVCRMDIVGTKVHDTLMVSVAVKISVRVKPEVTVKCGVPLRLGVGSGRL
jgi:hypothetical protein